MAAEDDDTGIVIAGVRTDTDDIVDRAWRVLAGTTGCRLAARTTRSQNTETTAVDLRLLLAVHGTEEERRECDEEKNTDGL